MPDVPAHNRIAKTLMVAYEVATDKAAAQALEYAIVRLGGRWARPLTGVWYVETHEPATVVTDRLAPLVNDEDALIVQEITGSAGVHNTLVRWAGPYLSSSPTLSIRERPPAPVSIMPLRRPMQPRSGTGVAA